MNICFLIGKIISEIKYDFVIGNKKYFSKEKITVARFNIELLNKSEISIIAYNSIADFCYQKLDKNYNIFIEGLINTVGNIEIKNIKII